MLAGDAKRELGDPAAARAFYEKALLRDNSDLATLLALAHLDFQTKRYRNAITWLERLLFIDPDHYAAHLLASRCYEQGGSLERAVHHLWMARELDGNPSRGATEYRDKLIDLYRRLQKREGRKKN